MRALLATLTMTILGACVSPAAERQAAIDIGAEAAADLDKQAQQAPAPAPAPNN